MLSVEISDYDIEIALTDNRTINFYSQDFQATSVLVLPFFHKIQVRPWSRLSSLGVPGVQILTDHLTLFQPGGPGYFQTF